MVLQTGAQEAPSYPALTQQRLFGVAHFIPKCSSPLELGFLAIFLISLMRMQLILVTPTVLAVS